MAGFQKRARSLQAEGGQIFMRCLLECFSKRTMQMIRGQGGFSGHFLQGNSLLSAAMHVFPGDLHPAEKLFSCRCFRGRHSRDLSMDLVIECQELFGQNEKVLFETARLKLLVASR